MPLDPWVPPPLMPPKPPDAKAKPANTPTPAPGSSSAGSAITTSNPSFDPRIRRIYGQVGDGVGGLGHQGDPGDYNRGSSPLFRGRIETKQPVNGAYRSLYFLYNPAEITWTGSVNDDVAGDSQVLGAGDKSNWMMPMKQTVEFALLFDRTYETWVYNKDKEVSRLGVLVDVKHLYAMLGVLGDGAPVTPAPGTAPKPTLTGATRISALSRYVDLSKIDDPSPTSFMQFIPMRVIFNRHMSYHGVIVGASVKYTQFTYRMIPVRCAVSISMDLFPVTPEEVLAGTSIGKDKAAGTLPTTPAR